MFIKVVHPGGHVELHDRPISAEEIMQRNPKCIVAYPNVFQQPTSIVAPSTTLILGQKYYVVPVTTIRKLQKLYSPSRQAKRIKTNDDVIEKRCVSKNDCRGVKCLNKLKTKESNSIDGENSSNKLVRKVSNKDLVGKESSPKRLSNSVDYYWHPNLESITEE